MHSVSRLTLVIGLSLATTTTLAGAQKFQTARSLGMAGTGVAVAHPGTANSTNPAMLAAPQHGWADDFAIILPSINARVADKKKTVDQIDDIQETIDRLEQDTDALNTGAAQQSAGELRDQLQAFDQDTVRLDAGAGLSIALPGPSLAAGIFTNASLRVTARGEYDEDDDARLAAIEAGVLNPNFADELESRGRVLASALGEVGVSFAHSLELASGNRLQLGVSPKYVQMRTFQYTRTVVEFEDDEFDSGNSETDKSGLNFDLGAAYAFGHSQQWNSGIAIKNVIPMELDSAASRPDDDVRTYELDPLITVGIAHSGDFHVVTADLDLTETKAFGFGDDTQWLAVGAEFDAFRYAQLRMGVRQNLASNDNNEGIEEETQLTFGIGLSPFGARLDVAGLVSDADTGVALELGAAF
ncbi:MAG: conjugal transfer protein TraF [Marinobacter sp.]|uniref:conjugal transfer protein TraF n=1 Tax=Marinobacter sp. TaxID=50741 RepID=UPI0034A0A911